MFDALGAHSFSRVKSTDDLVSGRKLFGNFTFQSELSPDEKNGFRALAEWDKPENGGNSDSVISQSDDAFRSSGCGAMVSKTAFPIRENCTVCGSMASRGFPSSTANRVTATSMAMNSGNARRSMAHTIRRSAAGPMTCI